MDAPNINVLTTYASIPLPQNNIADSQLKMEAGPGKITNQIKDIALRTTAFLIRAAAAGTLASTVILLISCPLTPLVGFGALLGVGLSGGLLYASLHLSPTEARVNESLVPDDQGKKTIVEALSFEKAQEEIKPLQGKIESIDQQLADIKFIEKVKEEQRSTSSTLGKSLYYACEKEGKEKDYDRITQLVWDKQAQGKDDAITYEEAASMLIKEIPHLTEACRQLQLQEQWILSEYQKHGI